MAEKFVAQKLDLDLELTLLSGEEVALSPKMVINTDNILKIVREWDGLEKRITTEAEEEKMGSGEQAFNRFDICLLYTSPSPRDGLLSRMPSSA